MALIDTKPMRQQRAKLVNDAQAIVRGALNAKRSVSAEEQQQVDKMLDEERSLKSAIDAAEHLNASDTELSQSMRPGITIGDRILGAGAGNDAENAKAARQLEAFRSYVLYGSAMPDNLRGELDALRSVTVAGSSGYTVPQGAMQPFVDTLADFTDIRQAPVSVISTTTGSDLPLPTFDDTASDADETAEGEDRGDADEPTIGQILLKHYLSTTGVLKVSEQFLRDSVQGESYIITKLGERVARRQNKLFTIGSGVNQAQGVVTAAGIGITLAAGHGAAIGVGASAAEMSQDLQNNLNGLIHSVIKPYRQKGQCGFMLSDLTAKHIKSFVDSTGRGLWQPSLSAEADDTLMGYPAWINTSMPEIAANARAMLFGNFSYYSIRYVGAMAVKRLIERYAEFGLVGFIGYLSADGKLTDSSAIKSLIMSA